MNTKLLKAKMVENDITQNKLAKDIGISANSLSRKLNGSREFKLSEICSICEVLSIEDPIAIFLSK